MQHKPWPENPAMLQRINGERIGIVGYSHYNDDDNDGDWEDYTLDTVQGNRGLAFFQRISQACGFDDADEFFDSVCFFNYCPSVIGGRNNKHAYIPFDQINLANERLQAIAHRYELSRILIFSRKAWMAMFDQHHKNDFLSWTDTLQNGRYRIDVGGIKTETGAVIPMFGLPHPQFTSKIDLAKCAQGAMEV